MIKNSGDIAWSKKTKKIKGVSHTAVLISHGYGAGWSTWNERFSSFLLFDKGIVELVLRGKKDEVEEYVKKKVGDEHVFLGGLDDLDVEWVREGTRFIVDEYDGSESIIMVEHMNFFNA